MSPANLESDLRATLRDRVGGFLRNTRHEDGITCRICSVPTQEGICPPCQRHREEFGPNLADLVVTLAYVRGKDTEYHQSAYMMRAYKQTPGRNKNADDLALMVTAATHLHRSCMRDSVGMSWEAVTFVPSSRMPGPDHPVAELARHVAGPSADQRFALSLGTGAGDANRAVRSDQFAVPERFHELLSGRHAVIVDDTWVSGAKAQSAALAVRAAGAAKITVLSVARWCRYDWVDHRAFLDSRTLPYDAFLCPVASPNCPWPQAEASHRA